ncbi:unnamed protein product [Pedinophyceae sp. YPF-701]|nr:unnamed protein product [Pedinophyceae sp. YPF-701]
MMRQAGRYQAAYRELAKKHPSFRVRSETTDLIVDITLQPWRSFKPDGLILFSDILTPLPALGIPFEIDDNKGPLIDAPLRNAEDMKTLHALDLSQLTFVGEALTELRNAVKSEASPPAVLGFVGSPWTMATYIVEGKSTPTYKIIKTMAVNDPEALDTLLSHLSAALADYIVYQIEAGAQAVQVFDSWGGQLPPSMWDRWSGPYIKDMIKKVKDKYPAVPLTLYANGSGGLLERMADAGPDVIGLDWTVDMADARRRLGGDVGVQGNVDPIVLFGGESAIEGAVRECLGKAGTRGHILNLGHGVMVGTPEESVAHFFEFNRSMTYDKL